MNFTTAQMAQVIDVMAGRIIFTISNGNTVAGLAEFGYDTYKTILKSCEKSGLSIVAIEIF